MQPQPTSQRTHASDWSLSSLALLALLSVVAFLVMGYHPGLEDDAFYLAAIKKNLNPALFPHDADFFRLQFQATIFDKLIAFSVRLAHLPLAWVVLLWQFAAIFFLLHGCWRISRRCFSDTPAQWSVVALIAVLLTLPVSGTGINLADQYLHPRTLATDAILAAVVAILDFKHDDFGDNRRLLWLAGFWLAVAFSIHAIMASFGISFCAILLWNQLAPHGRDHSTVPIAAALLMPFTWIFEPASDAWRQAAASRSFYFVAQWQWYEWLGIFAPLVLLFIFLRFLRRHGEPPDTLSTLVSSLLYYGIFQTVVGLAIMLPPSLERLRPFEPMRYLHLVYLLFFLIVGGLIGRYVLGRHLYRWLLLFVPLGAGMFYAQRQMLPETAHLELPGIPPRNPWLEAFAWISQDTPRKNTPVDSLFALDPHYTELPDEDFYGFRALAERSVLADYVKDGGMAARVPRLAPRWLKEVNAQSGWRNFQAADFQRLKNEFGVNWVILSRTDRAASTLQDNSAPGMTCPYANQQLLVCRLY
jgi:hypothetical protein